MAYDGTAIDYRIGEKGPLATTATVVSSGGSITGIVPGSYFTAYDPSGSPVAGYTNLPISNYGNAQVAPDEQSAIVYINLDTSGVAYLTNPLPANVYYGIFSYKPQTSDNLSRIKFLDIQFRVLPIVETVATFDPLTIRGRLRMELQDISDFHVPGTAVGITNSIFSDAEVDAFLYQANSLLVPTNSVVPGGVNTGLSNKDLYMAAYYAWTNIAANKASLVKVKRILFIQSNTMPTYQAAKQQAEMYLIRASADTPGSVSPSTGNYNPTDEILGWERYHTLINW